MSGYRNSPPPPVSSATASHDVTLKFENQIPIIGIIVFYTAWLLFQTIYRRDMFGFRRLTSKIPSFLYSTSDTTQTDGKNETKSAKSPDSSQEKGKNEKQKGGGGSTSKQGGAATKVSGLLRREKTLPVIPVSTPAAAAATENKTKSQAPVISKCDSASKLQTQTFVSEKSPYSSVKPSRDVKNSKSTPEGKSPRVKPPAPRPPTGEHPPIKLARSATTAVFATQKESTVPNNDVVEKSTLNFYFVQTPPTKDKITTDNKNPLKKSSSANPVTKVNPGKSLATAQIQLDCGKKDTDVPAVIKDEDKPVVPKLKLETQSIKRPVIESKTTEQQQQQPISEDTTCSPVDIEEPHVIKATLSIHDISSLSSENSKISTEILPIKLESEPIIKLCSEAKSAEVIKCTVSCPSESTKLPTTTAAAMAISQSLVGELETISSSPAPATTPLSEPGGEPNTTITISASQPTLQTTSLPTPVQSVVTTTVIPTQIVPQDYTSVKNSTLDECAAAAAIIEEDVVRVQKDCCEIKKKSEITTTTATTAESSMPPDNVKPVIITSTDPPAITIEPVNKSEIIIPPPSTDTRDLKDSAENCAVKLEESISDVPRENIIILSAEDPKKGTIQGTEITEVKIQKTEPPKEDTIQSTDTPKEGIIQDIDPKKGTDHSTTDKSDSIENAEVCDEGIAQGAKTPKEGTIQGVLNPDITTQGTLEPEKDKTETATAVTKILNGDVMSPEQVEGESRSEGVKSDAAPEKIAENKDSPDKNTETVPLNMKLEESVPLAVEAAENKIEMSGSTETEPTAKETPVEEIQGEAGIVENITQITAPSENLSMNSGTENKQNGEAPKLDDKLNTGTKSESGPAITTPASDKKLNGEIINKTEIPIEISTDKHAQQNGDAAKDDKTDTSATEPQSNTAPVSNGVQLNGEINKQALTENGTHLKNGESVENSNLSEDLNINLNSATATESATAPVSDNIKTNGEIKNEKNAQKLEKNTEEKEKKPKIDNIPKLARPKSPSKSTAPHAFLPKVTNEPVKIGFGMLRSRPKSELVPPKRKKSTSGRPKSTEVKSDSTDPPAAVKGENGTSDLKTATGVAKSKSKKEVTSTDSVNEPKVVNGKNTTKDKKENKNIELKNKKASRTGEEVLSLTNGDAAKGENINGIKNIDDEKINLLQDNKLTKSTEPESGEKINSIAQPVVAAESLPVTGAQDTNSVPPNLNSNTTDIETKPEVTSVQPTQVEPKQSFTNANDTQLAVTSQVGDLPIIDEKPQDLMIEVNAPQLEIKAPMEVIDNNYKSAENAAAAAAVEISKAHPCEKPQFSENKAPLPQINLGEMKNLPLTDEKITAIDTGRKDTNSIEISSPSASPCEIIKINGDIKPHAETSTVKNQASKLAEKSELKSAAVIEKSPIREIRKEKSPSPLLLSKSKSTEKLTGRALELSEKPVLSSEINQRMRRSPSLEVIIAKFEPKQQEHEPRPTPKFGSTPCQVAPRPELVEECFTSETAVSFRQTLEYMQTLTSSSSKTRLTPRRSEKAASPCTKPAQDMTDLCPPESTMTLGVTPSSSVTSSSSYASACQDEIRTPPVVEPCVACDLEVPPSSMTYDPLPPVTGPVGVGFGVVRANTGRKIEEDRFVTEVEVFFRSGVLSQLESQRDERLQDHITRFQARCRGYLARRRFVKRKVQDVAIRCVQRNVRRFLQVRDWPWWRLLIRVAPLLNVHRAEEELKTKTEELETLRARLEKVEAERTRFKQDSDRLEARLSELSVALSEEHSTSTLASERLEAEVAERLRLQAELDHIQVKHTELQAASERLEMELLFCRAADMNGSSHAGASSCTTTEDEGDADPEGTAGAALAHLKQRLERANREIAMNKRRLQQQHEDDIEQMMALKKMMEKKLADAYEEVEEQRQVAAQWKRKAQRVTSEGNDSRLLLEEQAARNTLLEKRQRKFDGELQQLQESLRQEKTARDRAQRERDMMAAEKGTVEQTLAACRLELELREEKVGSLSRELEELQFGGAAEEEVAALRKSKHTLDLKLKEQEEELDDLAGQVSMLEQAKLRLEMTLEQQRKEMRKDLSQREDEMEEVRCNAQKKVKSLECQLESEHEERTRLLREKHELERRLTEAIEAARGRAPEDEQVIARLRRDLRHTKALLRDAHTMLEKYKNEAPGKGQIRQLRHQLEDAEFARTAALRAKQTAETELRDTQASLEEAMRARADADDRAAGAVRERTEARGQLEENEEELAEVLKKYRAAVAQVSQEQTALQEATGQVASLEAERNSLKEQLAELAARVECVEGEAVSSLTQRRLEMRARELESRLELEQTTRSRLETQISRLKDTVEKLQGDADQLRAKEATAQDATRRLQRQLREAREAEATQQAREAEWSRKRKELELRAEAAEGESSTARTDLRLALQRVEDLQSAMAGELNSSASGSEDSEGDSDSDESIGSFLLSHKSTLRSTSCVESVDLDFSCRSPEGQSDPGDPTTYTLAGETNSKSNESHA